MIDQEVNVGNRVRSLRDFPYVPAGTEGKIIEIIGEHAEIKLNRMVIAWEMNGGIRRDTFPISRVLHVLECVHEE